MPEVTPPKAKKLTQKQKILAIMCKEPNRWFFPYEFMQPNLGAMFVGYEAPTRIAEMHASYPDMFEKRWEDKYLQRRLNVNGFSSWYETLKPDLKDIVDRFYKVGDLPL